MLSLCPYCIMATIRNFFRNIFRRSARTGGTNYLQAMGATQPTTGAPLSVAAAYRCVKLMSDTVASLPIHKKELRNGVMVAVHDHLDYLLSVQPNPWTSSFDFWGGVTTQLLMQGNAYIFPVYEKESLKLRHLVLASPGTVAHDVTTDTYTVMDMNQNLSGTYAEEDVIHIKHLSLDGKRGIGVITYAMRTLGIATAGDREALNKFENGGTVKGILSVKDGGSSFLQDNDEEAYKVAQLLNRQKNEHDIVALPGEYEFKQYSMTPAEQQFLESRKFTVLEVCRFFGVHPSFVYADTSSNYKSAEMANVAFLSNTLNPILKKIENELIRKFTGEQLSRYISFEFDRTGIYACDLESRVNYMTKLIGLGRTVNELRLMDNLPPVEDGDTPMVSANLRPLGDLTQGNAGESVPELPENEENTEENGEDKEESLSE